MAVRDGDVALWLHNKLGSTDDLWSGRSICAQLSQQRLQNIQECFPGLQPHVKVKLLLSFVHLQRRHIEEWKLEIEEILELASTDGDQWVSMVGEILRPFPNSGGLNMDIDSSNRTFNEVLNDLKKLVRKSTDVGMLPMECLYLSRNALASVAGHQTPPIKKFALKRKPKSATLRAEILQKSAEAAVTQKSRQAGGSSSLPIKVRSFAKILDDDKSPLKGIPSRTPTSGGFRANPAFRFGGNPSASRTPLSRKEGGIKILDITEQPVAGKEAKRRRRQHDQEVQEQMKREKLEANSTPDYAAGLMSPAGPVMNNLVSPVIQTVNSSTYTPSSGTRLPSISTLTDPPLQSSNVSSATQVARENLQAQLQNQIRTQPAPSPQIPIQPAPTLPTPIQPAPQTQQKGLVLTKEQITEAQDMFRTSNKVTRPEKALILGFMAGSRANPCPQQGDVVNIRLSEDSDSLQQPDGAFRPMLVDTFFQMNFATGEWKRTKKYREIEPE